jgi:hypothetical protein
MALMRGMVIVGDLAFAVNGNACPFRIKLQLGHQHRMRAMASGKAYPWVKAKPLSLAYTKSLFVSVQSLDKIGMKRHLPAQGIHYHEDQTVEVRCRWQAIFKLFVLRQARKKRLMGKESGRKDEDGQRDQKVGNGKKSPTQGRR